MKKHLSKLKRHYIPKSTKLYEQQNPVYHGVHLPNRSVEMRGGVIKKADGPRENCGPALWEQ